MFRVTQQVASVVEISYDVDAPDEDAVYDLEPQELEANEVHRQTIRKHAEIISVEDVSRDCPNCGRYARAHTGPYCHDCGEKLGGEA